MKGTYHIMFGTMFMMMGYTGIMALTFPNVYHSNIYPIGLLSLAGLGIFFIIRKHLSKQQNKPEVEHE